MFPCLKGHFRRVPRATPKQFPRLFPCSPRSISVVAACLEIVRARLPMLFVLVISAGPYLQHQESKLIKRKKKKMNRIRRIGSSLQVFFLNGRRSLLCKEAVKQMVGIVLPQSPVRTFSRIHSVGTRKFQRSYRVDLMISPISSLSLALWEMGCLLEPVTIRWGLYFCS